MASKQLPPTIEAVTSSPQLVQHRKLPAEQILAVLAQLETRAGFQSAFVREAMRQAPPGELLAHWARTSEALSKAGRQYSLGDAAFRQTLQLMQAPWRLAACQAGTIAGAAPRVIIAALAADGSEGSHDALVAEFERARRDPDDADLRTFRKIARHATRNQAWEALEAAVDRALASRDQVAAANEDNAARKLGLEIALLKWSAYVRASRGPSLWVLLDDQRKRATLNYTRPDGSREPAALDVATLPRRLAKIVRRDRVKFDWATAKIHTNLRGKKRAAFEQWVQGKRTSPLPDRAQPKKKRPET